MSTVTVGAQPIQWIPADGGVPDSVLLSPLLNWDGGLLGLDQWSGSHLYRSVDRGATWEEIPADGLLRAGEALIGTRDGALVASVALTEPPLRSEDGGATWTPLDLSLRANEVVFTLGEADDGALLAGSGYDAIALFGQIYRSDDGGQTWTPADTGPTWGTTRSLSKAQDGTFYAAHTAGFEGGDQGISRSTDDGRTWTMVFPTPVEAVAALDGDRVLALMTSGDIARSTDGGDTWSVVGSVPNTPRRIEWMGAFAVAYGSASDPYLYVSFDGGATWEPSDDGLGEEGVWDVVQDGEGYLYATTEDGVFRSATSLPVGREAETPPQQTLALGVYPNPARGRTTIRYVLAEPGAYRLVAYDVLGREVAVVSSGTTGAGAHTLDWDVRRLRPGLYVLQLQAGAQRTTRKLLVTR